MGKFLHPEHRKKLEEVFREKGYHTRNDVVRELVGSGHYKGRKVETVGVRITTAFQGYEPIPKKMIGELERICCEDERVSFLNDLPEFRFEHREGYMTKEENVILREVLHENGYETLRMIADELTESGSYKGRDARKIVGPFLSKVLCGRNKIPSPLAQDLLRLAKYDPKVSFLLKNIKKP